MILKPLKKNNSGVEQKEEISGVSRVSYDGMSKKVHQSQCIKNTRSWTKRKERSTLGKRRTGEIWAEG